MSDNEDTLEEIKAIQEVLSQDDFDDYDDDHHYDNNDEDDDDNKRFDRKPSVSHNPYSTFDSDDESPDDDAHKLAVESLKSVENLMLLCKQAEQAIQAKIEENAKKRQEVDYQIHLLAKGGRANWRVPYNKAGMPYFKDEKQFPAPKNEDTKMKEKNNELLISHLRRPIRWTYKDRNYLRIAIRKQAASDTFDKMIRDSSKNDTTSTELQPPKDLRTMVGPLGAREFDWMKISTIDMKCRHTPNECRVMWNILLHPDINDSQWKTDEEELLKAKAREHKLQDWDTIAKELNTGRTGYVCFIAFHRTLENSVYNDRVWSLHENRILSESVERLRFGDFIPWGRVSTYINDRTKTQIYARWKYNLDPSLKKGRFTSEEDDLLLDSVAKYGQNFPRISSDIMPYRSSVQLSGRFKLLMLKTNSSYNSWSVAEDRKLIQLYEEFGSQWSMIASIMKKDRTYLRHRYTIVTRHMSKGVRLANIPRKRPIDEVDYEDDDEVDDTDSRNDNMGTDSSIDAQLMRYFQGIQATESKPGRKAVYHTPDQLELRTKKLDQIFETLNVKIEIPDNLDGYDLSEKNKQLLSSYKEYIHLKSSVKPQVIEEYRQKMFGDFDLNDFSEPFIPPAPFGLFQNGTKRINQRKKAKFDGRLDAEPVQNLQIVLDMNMETPSNVLEKLNEEEKEQFDKISQLVASKCTRLQFAGRFEQAYVPSVELASKPAKKLHPSDKLKFKPVPDYEPESWRHASLKKDLSIPPNYSTLLGYQALLNFRESQSIMRNRTDDLTTPDLVKLTDEGKQAFHLFKTRLRRLFKYPILMSRIIPKNNKLPDRTTLKEGEGIQMDKKRIKLMNEEDNENDPSSELNDDYERSSDFDNEPDNLQDPLSQQEIKCEIKYDINENGQEQTKRFVLSVKLDQVK